MKRYINPEIEITLIDVTDIIQASTIVDGGANGDLNVPGGGTVVFPSKPSAFDVE